MVSRPAASPTGGACPFSETEPPIIHTVQISPSEIDVSQGPVAVQIRAQVTDGGGSQPASGVRSVFVDIGAGVFGRWSPGREHDTVALSPEEGDWWSGTMTVGQWDGYVSPWFLQSARAQDRAGNYGSASWSSTDPSRQQLVIAAHPTDGQRPYLADLAISRRVLDVRNKNQKLAIRAHVTDLGGSGAVVVGFGRRALHTDLALTSGTPQDGWWTGQLLVRRGSDRGYHRVVVTMSDAAYRHTETDFDRLQARGLPWRYRIRSIPDTTAPSLISGNAGDAQVDAATGHQGVPISVRVADAQAGTAGVTLVLQEGRTQFLETTTVLRLRTGTRHNGRWRGIIRIPGCTIPPGTYSLIVQMTDRVGNESVAVRRSAVRLR
jgi:hypothetical protein